MSPIRVDDLHRIFKNLDKNNSGQVSVQELLHLLDKIGIHTTLEELEKFVGRTSLDYIDFLFFYEAMVKARMAEEEEGHDQSCDNNENDLLKAFKVFDLNGDGHISCDELQSVLSRLGLWDKRSGKDCKDMIRVYDENSDGVLDFEEFKNMMSVPAPISDPEI
ncbi:Calmodulin and related proteins (EF-Hand superfamily) [Handroanthus impetiginosus]|uniref:Calmodulin and related proteins (EF-Hand superfamily) n=1 Tax=Handroanthus impetiginosus TaxID=429701 RepID=A0A2G9HG57_9LAMI|nr:Calmodulin and related proteins (EF-Hand superfamily) [Handroanthus impetiginosus]